MADNLQLSSNIGTGEKLATDEDASSNHYQKIKLFSSVADSTTGIGTGPGTEATSLRVTLPTDGTGIVKLGAGTASVGTVGLNTGTNAIGSVKVAGSVAHDAVGTSILPVLGGNISKEIDGTSPGLVAEDDISYGKSDREGRMLVSQVHPYLFSASVDYAAAAQTNATIQAAVTAVSIFITDITYSNGPTAVNNVTLLDGSGGTVMHEVYLAVNNTVHIALNTPIKLTVNTLLALTSTGTTELACNVSGYYAV